MAHASLLAEHRENEVRVREQQKRGFKTRKGRAKARVMLPEVHET
jgi:hypothetical protein